MRNIAKPEKTEFSKVKDRDNAWAELKYDGTRMLIISDGNNIKFVNKRGKDKTDLYPEFEDLELPKCIIDGEMVVTDDDNPHGNFRKLLKRDSGSWSFKKKLLYKKMKSTYIAFDVIEWKGESYQSVPLRDRRNKLEQILGQEHKHLETSVVYEDISDAWVRVVDNNLEGIIIKDKDKKYPEGRTRKWLKVKNTKDLNRKVHNIEEHDMGIRVETKKEGQGLTINGKKAEEVKQIIKEKGEAEIEVTCLEKIDDETLREPVFKRVIE